MNGQGVDTDVVEGVGVAGVCPDDGAGVDRTIDQEILSSSHSSSDGKNF